MIHSPTWGTLEHSNKNIHSQEKNQTHVRCRRQKHSNINTKSHQKFYLNQGTSTTRKDRDKKKTVSPLVGVFPLFLTIPWQQVNKRFYQDYKWNLKAQQLPFESKFRLQADSKVTSESLPFAKKAPVTFQSSQCSCSSSWEWVTMTFVIQSSFDRLSKWQGALS